MKNKTAESVRWRRYKSNYDFIGDLIDYAESGLSSDDEMALKLVGYLYCERKRNAFLANCTNTESELGKEEL